MDKIKIILIDSDTDRRQDIWGKIQSFNEIPFSRACFSHIWKDYQKKQMRNDWRSKPDLFLLHLSDQQHKKIPYYEYLKHINRKLPDGLVVLYSGGGIDVKEHTADRLTVTQSGGEPWDFDVTNGDRFCIITDRVSSAENLHIVPALEKYTAGGIEKEFFDILLRTEASQEYLAALAILCQGYLVVHTNPDTGKLDLSEDDSAYAPCLKALEAMDWQSFVTEKGPGKELLSPILKDPQAKQEMQTQVCDASWWQVFGGGDLMKQVHKEWGSDKPEGLAEVDELVKPITDKQHIPPKDVAQAYLAISHRLERRGS